MKVVPFKVPQTRKEAFRVQIDELPHFYDKLHQHHEVQLMWIEASEGVLIAGDYVGRFKPGDLYILGSGQPHVFRNDSIESTNQRTEARSLSIYFDESYLGNHFWQLEEMEAIKNLITKAARGFNIHGETRERAKEIISRMVREADTARIIYFLVLLELLSNSSELTPLSVTAPQESYNQNEGKRMNDILQFTFEQSHRKIYIEEVAQIANLSTEAFCRYFKTRTGKTYTHFLNEVRVSNACKMLIGKEVNIQEVCYNSGFSNLSNFNRTFKKIAGKSPSKYIS